MPNDFVLAKCHEEIQQNKKSNEHRLKEDFIMAFVITDSCVSCGSCAGECPVGAISQGDGKYEIDANSCIDCGTCAGVCPTGAIEQG